MALVKGIESGVSSKGDLIKYVIDGTGLSHYKITKVLDEGNRIEWVYETDKCGRKIYRVIDREEYEHHKMVDYENAYR